jgi:hypothetical protein
MDNKYILHLSASRLSPTQRRRHRKPVHLEVVLDASVDQEDFLIRLNAPRPARRPHNMSEETWEGMLFVYRALKVRPRYIVDADQLRR